MRQHRWHAKLPRLSTLQIKILKCYTQTRALCNTIYQCTVLISTSQNKQAKRKTSFDVPAGSRFPYDMLMLIRKRNAKPLVHKKSIPLICIKDINQGPINFDKAQFAFAIGNISRIVRARKPNNHQQMVLKGIHSEKTKSYQAVAEKTFG